MNQIDELAIKCVFGTITLLVSDYLIFLQFDFLICLAICSLFTGLSYILIIVLLQELTVFPYRLPVYCMSMVLS